MKRSRIGMAWLAALVVLSMALAACGTSQKPADTGATTQPTDTTPSAEPPKDGPVDGGTLVYGNFADIVNLNPIFLDDTASGDVAQLLAAPLYSVDSKARIAADEFAIAAALPEVSADGLTWIIKLKDTPKWSDGTPVTADDVVFTFQTFANPEVGSPAISNFDKVAEIKALDPRTVQIVLKEVYAPFEYVLNTSLIPYHLLKDVKAADLQAHRYGKDIAATVQNGPYRWTEWAQNQYVTLERNPDYWGPRPHIDKFIYKVYADQQTVVQALLTGDVDMITGIPVGLLETVKGKEGIAVIEQPGPYYDYLGFNFDGSNFPGERSPFASARTRQALYHAINRQGMVDSILRGHGGLLNGPFLPTGWAYTEGAATNFAYDPDKARQLLAEDGWVPGADGILAKDGQRFSFTLQFNAGNARREQVSTVIQQNLKDVGIEVKIEAMEWSAWLENNVIPGKFQAIILGWQLSIDPDAESLFSSAYFPPTGQNSGWYRNEKTDQLWKQGYATTDKEQRRRVYADISREFSADPPYVFLMYRNELMAVSSRVHWAEEHAPVLSIPYGYLLHVNRYWVTDR